MNTKLALLGSVLVLQLFVIALVWFGADDRQQEQTLWLDNGPDALNLVDTIRVDGEGSEIMLSKTPSGWTVQGAPADAVKIEALLAKLSAMIAPWPVASSGESAERFEVAADNYQRRVQLLNGEATLVDLYLGTSPSYQRVHARQAQDDAIYSIELSNFEVPANLDGWLDKTLLSVEEPVTAVVVDLVAEDEGVVAGPVRHQLEKQAEGWLYNGDAASQDATETYVRRFENLSVLGVAAVDEPELLAEIELTTATRSKTLYIAKQGEDYLVSEANFDEDATNAYKIATYLAEQLLLTDVELSIVAAQEGQVRAEPEQLESEQIESE